MSIGNRPAFAATSLAVVVAAITSVGSAVAADMPVKAQTPPPEPPFFLVNQNSLSYSYAFTANNPGAGKT
ncbi:MAG TPA: hypothetical protein VKT99_10675, partial [Xanthobacteraceae bacterium]|nr:hypothetical protein [Xanthobacteraceae bacterium]